MMRANANDITPAELRSLATAAYVTHRVPRAAHGLSTHGKALDDRIDDPPPSIVFYGAKPDARAPSALPAP